MERTSRFTFRLYAGLLVWFGLPGTDLFGDEPAPVMYARRPPAVGSVDMATRIDLKQSLDLAGRNMLEILRPDANHLPHWSCFTAVWPYIKDTKFGSRWPGHNLGRWWDAMLRLEDATGFATPPHIEEAMLENLKRFFDNSDHLCLAPADYHGVEPCFDLHSLREGLLALNALVRYRNSGWARAKGHAMIESLLARMNDDGSWNVEGFDYPRRMNVKSDTAASHREYTNSHGRLIEALAWFHQATGDPAALRLAARSARYHLEHTVRSDGAFNNGSRPSHSHSYVGTLRGLLLFGELTGQREYVDAVAATFRQTLRDRLVKRSGFSPHDIGGETGETASTGDAAQIALWLGTRHGYAELLDDAARLLRCRIVPSQLTDVPTLVSLPPNGAQAVEDRYRDVEKRIIGAYGGCHRYPHAGKSCVTDVTAAVLHTVVDFYNHIATPTDQGIKVNFHLDYESESLRVTSVRKTAATVTIAARAKDNVLVRIPRWTPKDSVRITVNGRPVELSMVGGYALIDRALLPGRIVLTYALPITAHKERTAGVEYEFLWRGDEIIGVYPNTGYFPFYPTYLSPETNALRKFRSAHNLAVLARGAKATASSHLAALDGVGDPANAIDEDDENLWISKDPVAEGRPQWLQVDLGGTVRVRAVVIDHRFDLISPGRSHLEASLAGRRFDVVGPVWTTKANRRTTFECDTPIEARYVRYVSEDERGRQATMGRIEVYDRAMPQPDGRHPPPTNRPSTSGGAAKMQSPTPFYTVVAPTSPGNPRNSEDAIIELENGSLLLAWTDFYAGHDDDHAPARISGMISTDGGRTWVDKYTLVENDAGCNVMEVNFLRLRNDDLALFHCQKNTRRTDCRVIMRTSSDEGKTWRVAAQLSAPGKYTGLTNSRCIRLETGRILLEAWEGGDSYCYLSDDDGRTWRESQRVRPAGGECAEPACIELKDGRVMMLMRTELGCQYKSVSNDGGQTWSDPAPTPLRGSAAPVFISRIPTTGDLLAIWNHNPAKLTPGQPPMGIPKRNPLTAAISKDEGETWQNHRNLVDDPRDAWDYPAVTWIGNRAIVTYSRYARSAALLLKIVPARWFYE